MQRIDVVIAGIPFDIGTNKHFGRFDPYTGQRGQTKRRGAVVFDCCFEIGRLKAKRQVVRHPITDLALGKVSALGKGQLIYAKLSVAIKVIVHIRTAKGGQNGPFAFVKVDMRRNAGTDAAVIRFQSGQADKRRVGLRIGLEQIPPGQHEAGSNGRILERNRGHDDGPFAEAQLAVGCGAQHIGCGGGRRFLCHCVARHLDGHKEHRCRKQAAKAWQKAAPDGGPIRGARAG